MTQYPEGSTVLQPRKETKVHYPGPIDMQFRICSVPHKCPCGHVFLHVGETAQRIKDCINQQFKTLKWNYQYHHPFWKKVTI